jgi:hypothetical protein
MHLDRTSTHLARTRCGSDCRTRVGRRRTRARHTPTGGHDPRTGAPDRRTRDPDRHTCLLRRRTSAPRRRTSGDARSRVFRERRYATLQRLGLCPSFAPVSEELMSEVEQESEPADSHPRSTRGCVVGIVIGLIIAAWCTRLVVAVVGDRNGCFTVSGSVVNENGQLVPDALLSSSTVVSPFPKTETEYKSTKGRMDGGRFSVEACDVGDLDVYATRVGIGMSQIVSVRKAASVERMDWLGRHTFHARDVVLVLRPRAPAATPNPAAAGAPATAGSTQ